MARKISQREAHRMARELARLENQREMQKRTYAKDYPGGINVSSITLGDIQAGKLTTAKRLGFSLVATIQ